MRSILVCLLLICGSWWRVSAEEAWPELPTTNGAITIPAQEWPARPGLRNVRVLVHYPRGRLENVNAKTGLMLTLHNWGGEDCAGTAAPQALADRLNVIALCVNYLQSGAKDSIEGPEPYDFGYLQALDALRALWLVRHRLGEQKLPFADGRIFATGGSGGGNVALMANKLAPRTFACVVDMCGMKKLTADIAFNLPGGSGLDARWSRDPRSPSWLSTDAQDIRFVGHPGHLATMHELGSAGKVIVVHGVDDKTCPFADAEELVRAMQTAKLAVEPNFIDKSRVDGQIFTSTGHALGNRTEIVFTVAGEYLAPEGKAALSRKGKSDFELQDERVRYRTPHGEFVVSYQQGYPIGRFEPNQAPPQYKDHQDLLHYFDQAGKRSEIRTKDDWFIRRKHIRENWSLVAGVMPGASFRVPPDVQTIEETGVESITRRKVSFQSDPFDRVSFWLLIPEQKSVQKLPAMLCLHQTNPHGKDETAGVKGRASMHYGLELAKRGYVVVCPDYPSFGEHKYAFAAHPEFASGTLKAVWDNQRIIDLLCTLPLVDPDRIGVIGHSLGGHNAIFTALLEPRLKVIVSSCGFTRFARDDMPSWTGQTYMPRIASQFGNDVARVPFDFPELIAALAPRPFLACAAKGDTDFDVRGVQETIEAARPVYKLLGDEGALQGYYPDGPHEFPESARLRAYEFLDSHLGKRTSDSK